MLTLRTAGDGDVAALQAVAHAAYARYLDRMDRPPAPMLANYGEVVRAGHVSIAESDGAIAGFVVLEARGDHLFVENVAVAPDFQGHGLGRYLIAHAEAEARRRGCPEIRLYTNEAMVENLRFYARLGFEESHRTVEDGYRRVYLTKAL